MVQNLKELLGMLSDRNSETAACNEGNALVILCKDCEYTPEPASRECLRCMVERMSELGGSDRIILRTGKDVEISGRSGNLIRNLSSLRRWSMPAESTGYRCRRCNCSRSSVMRDLWDEFPEMGFPDMKYRLNQEGLDGDCRECIRSSIIAVEQLQSDIDRIVSGMSG